MKNINYSDFTYGINQPYFLPYIGYFSLINETERWIVFDEVQYVKQSWGNRNRILKHPEGLSWINIPIKKPSRGTLYSQIEIRNNIEWKDKLIRQFEYYKMHAPYYKVVIQLFEEIIEPDFDYLVDLNIHAMVKICEYLNISFNYVRYSELKLNISEVKSPGDWPLQICKKLDIKSYMNPYMGHFMFVDKDWDNANIKLQFIKNKNIKYFQKRKDFEEKLSIMDVLMWNSVEEVHKLMKSDICDKDELIKLINKREPDLSDKY